MVYNRIVTIPFVIYPHRYRCEQIQTILYTYTFDHRQDVLCGERNVMEKERR